ncbi:scarecrow-like protein 9 [Carex rostrata]
MALHKESLSHIISTKDPCSNFALNPHEKSAVLLDPTLDYISQFLLEDIDEDTSGYQETALTDMQKRFYDILGEKYPPLPDNQLLPKQSKVTPDFTISVLKDQVGPSYSESLATEFQRGVEEGLKFLPNYNKLPINLQVSNLSLDPMKNWESNNSLEFRLGVENKSGLPERSKGKKNLNDSDWDLSEEGRSHKIPMFSHEETIRDEMFDKVLLYRGENYVHEEILELNANSGSENQNQYDNINLKSLLNACAHEVSINDNKSATHLIKQIRKQASPIGDGIQRLSWILVDGLEARLAGTGRETYRRLVARRLSTTDLLKVHHMCMRMSSNFRVSHHFANEIILSATGTASKIHVIDFGINFGFQWPSLIQALAKRKGGIPTLPITGVDFPQPGFHPAQRIKETGKRLEDYARGFGVPLEYQGIASQWESIYIEDFRINDDEVLIVNNIYNLTRLRDESFLDMNRSINKLLNFIQEIKPKVYIQGVFNLSFSPFFIPRFRMVFLQYSRIFDMLDTFFPRNSKSRQLMERELLGPTIINQIACERSDLFAELENYKQWHKRILQTGFEQLPLDPRVVKECSEMVTNVYNEGFFIEEDCSWFLQGWKGNIMYAMSLWKPKVE